MSLNKFTDTQKGLDLNLKIGCDELSCPNIHIPIGGVIDAHKVRARNELEYVAGDLNSVNLTTPDRGSADNALKTDGLGSTFWAPVLEYNGTQPSVVGTHVKLSTTDGTRVDESKLSETATDLSMGGLNITSVGNIDGVDISALETNVNTNTVNIGECQSSGVHDGGILLINGGDNTKFDITDGHGAIVDNITDANNPVITDVTWTGKTAISVTNIATQLITFVYIDINGDVKQATSKPSNELLRSIIYLGVLVHVNKVILNDVNNEQAYSFSSYSQVRDLVQALGFLNVSGNVISPKGANLFVLKSAGTMYGNGINYENKKTNPNLKSLASKDTETDEFQYRLQNGDNVNLPGPTYPIDPNNYDLAGTLTPVPSNKWTIQRWYLFTANNLKAQPGQNIYNSLAEAKSNITTEAFVTEPSILANGLLIGYMVVKEGTSALNNTTDNYFLAQGKFGTSSSSSGALTLQQAYQNSPVEPEILTNATRTALTIQQGSGLDTDPVLGILNGAGTGVFSVSGEGNLSLSGILASSTTAIKIGQNSASSGSNTICIGNTARSGSGQNNIVIGLNAGDASLAGQDNIFIGRGAGDGILLGSNNICIGELTDCDVNTSDQIAIGDTATTTGTRAIAIGANVTAPTDECVIGDTNLNVLRTTTTNVCDLGSTGVRWKDGYFAGNLVVDGTVDGVDVAAISTTYLPLAGGTMTGDITMGGNAIITSGNPGTELCVNYYQHTGAIADSQRFDLVINKNAESLIWQTTLDNGTFISNALSIKHRGASNQGYVGVGTASAAYPLDVNGDTNILGDIIVSGSVDGVDVAGIPATIAPKIQNYYSAVNSIGASNTVTETSLFSLSGNIGTTTITANTAKVGDVYRIKMTGHVRTNGSQSFDIHPKFGGTWTTAKTVTISEASRVMWDLEYTMLVKVLGTVPTGNVKLTCYFKVYDSTNTFQEWVIDNVAQRDTTANQTFDVTAQWATANAANIIECQIATIEHFSS
jgi:hypothetical protein